MILITKFSSCMKFYQIRDKRPQKPPSAKFHTDRNISNTKIAATYNTILNFENLAPDSKSATFHTNSKNF